MISVWFKVISVLFKVIQCDFMFGVWFHRGNNWNHTNQLKSYEINWNHTEINLNHTDSAYFLMWWFRVNHCIIYAILPLKCSLSVVMHQWHGSMYFIIKALINQDHWRDSPNGNDRVASRGFLLKTQKWGMEWVKFRTIIHYTQSWELALIVALPRSYSLSLLCPPALCDSPDTPRVGHDSMCHCLCAGWGPHVYILDWNTWSN